MGGDAMALFIAQFCLAEWTTMSTCNLSIGELEAKYPLYCKALKILIKQGKTNAQLQRTLCWDRLRLLHRSLPRQYKSPERLMLIIQAEFASVQDVWGGFVMVEMNVFRTKVLSFVLSRIAELDQVQLYEDSYALTQEFREWLLDPQIQPSSRQAKP
jgi:hypothetical protein